MTTQASASSPSSLLPVLFHRDTLFLVEHNGEPYTPMRQIIQGMGLDWSSQFAKLKSNHARWSVVEITTQLPGDTQRRSVSCLPVRKLPAYFASIHPRKVKPSIRDKVIQYQNECDDVLWEYWSGHKAKNQQRTKITEAQISEAMREIVTHRMLSARWVLYQNGKNSLLQINEIPKDCYILPDREFASVIGGNDFPRSLLPGVLDAVKDRMRSIVSK